MGKINKLSVLSDDDEEKLAKLSKKERSKASYGKPDDLDVRNLEVLFITYDKVTGGALKRFFEELAVERMFIKDLKPIDKAEKFKFSFPEDLESEVQKYWPTIWTNEKHARWFLKKFPGFRAG